MVTVSAIVVLLVASTLGASATAAVPRKSASLGSAQLPAIRGITFPTTLTHVIIVMEENHDLNWTLTDPTFASLYHHHAHASNAYATCHPSAPNYIAVTSAEKFQCGSDRVTYYSATNLGSDAIAHGRSWQGLFDSMPSACDRSDHYPYIAHHNPWVYYSNLKSNCTTHDVPFLFSNGTSRLQYELKHGSLPALTFITPNMLHDAHDGSLAAASSWLTSYVLTPVNNSVLYHLTTVVFVLFDEAYKKSCGCSETKGYTAGGVSVSGGPVYLIAISALSPSTKIVSSLASDFSLVTTIEWLLVLPSLGHYDKTTSFPALKGLFT